MDLYNTVIFHVAPLHAVRNLAVFRRFNRRKIDSYAPNTKRLLWQTGVVTELITGRDGRVRMVRLRTPNGNILDRAIQSLYPLEIQEPRPEDPEVEPSESVTSVTTSDPEPEPQSHFCDSPGEDVGETFP